MMTAEEQTDRVSNDNEIPASQLSALLEVSRALSATLDLTAVMQTAIDAAVRVLALETGAIYLLTGETLFLGAATPPFPPEFPDDMRRAPVADHVHIARALETRSPVFVSDTGVEFFTEAERAILETRPLRSIMYVPLVADDEAIGTFIVASSTVQRAFAAADVELGQALASIIALAVANSRLYESQRTSLVDLARANAEAQSSRQQLRALASQLTAAEDRQRREIAVEIHDRVAQPLAVMKMKLHGGVTQFAPHADDSTYQLVLRLVDEALEESRAIMFEASPPYLFDMGLKAALEWLADRTTEHGVDCECFADPRIDTIEEDLRLFVFQAARELLANVVKHSGATYSSVSAVVEDDRLVLKVTDDGRGFPTGSLGVAPGSDHGFGLFSLQERTHYIDGTLDIASALGVGTTTVLTLRTS